jgi:hypothetical protein
MRWLKERWSQDRRLDAYVNYRSLRKDLKDLKDL